MSTKRKLQVAGFQDEPFAKRSHTWEPETHTDWLNSSELKGESQASGYPDGKCSLPPSSLPPSNMVSAIRELIDPDFDPIPAILNEKPRFLKSLPPRISANDVDFLRSRGALSIPEPGLRNELLRCYVKWVHSFMPVLDLHEFLRCIAQNDPNGNISLLLFQAVMFVGTAFVDLKYLQAAGYEKRKSARDVYFSRIKLLYSFECEEDRIAILQTVLLMTYWFEYDQESNAGGDIWDWIGICNTHSHSIGLNKDPTNSDMDPRTKRLRVRLWWSLYARDRLIAMGLRRPTHINEGTSDVPLLTLDDFNFESFHPSVLEMLKCRLLVNISDQKRLAVMFIEKVKLCQCVGRVLFAQYSASHRHFGTTNRTTITLVPREASESELTRCSRKLESWLGGLPKDIDFNHSPTRNSTEDEDVLFLHGAMLRMLYHATSSALHRPWASKSPKNKDHPKTRSQCQSTAREKMDDATTGITRIVQGLNRKDLTRFLPQSGVTVIIPAAVSHLANSTSADPIIQDISIHGFYKCVQALHLLQDMYPAADFEVANLEAAVKTQCESYGSFLKLMQGISLCLPRPRCQTDSPRIAFMEDKSDDRDDDYQCLMEPNDSLSLSPYIQTQNHNNNTPSPYSPTCSIRPVLLNVDQTPSHLPEIPPLFPDNDEIDMDLDVNVDMDMSWSNGFVAENESNRDSSSLGVRLDTQMSPHGNDFLALSQKALQPTVWAGELRGITGDLDRDLGLSESGDDLY
ncbi:hypothetical protein MPDQ_006769 [Monascus purpureus]|uniref:Xylanolytic transcriptional activator regulatory domain-containing protein n=1 Tax=Monascus purpureus TaxID=5098 RepID=A0A507QY01_MONPU|nr:hypothetical protein MPDQ_006769 [Monascus purpureus]BDD60459.1 hypothetical protein MAP00_005584 [Monascus purpureus]